jgi:polysaccharide biosynthesis protein PslA
MMFQWSATDPERNGNEPADSVTTTNAAGVVGRRISLHSCAAALMATDAAVLILSGAALAFVIGEGRVGAALFADWQLWALAFSVFYNFLVARTYGVYATAHILNLRRAFRRVPLALLTTFSTLLVIAVATKTAESYSRLWFFSWATLSGSLILLLRYYALTRAHACLARGHYVSKALSVGVFCDPIRPAEIARETGNEVRVLNTLRIENIGELATFSDMIARDEIDHVYIAALWVDIPAVLRNVNLLRHLSTRVFILAGDRAVRSNVVAVSMFGERLSFCAIEEPIHGWSLWMKRMEDILISSAALAVLAPLMLAVALAVKLESKGPVFFRQTRVGFNGRTFALWKFRSMYADKTDHHAAKQTSRNDPRVTRVGRFIRRTSLDELPQLLNVLFGEMSIIGPRPHALQTKTQGKNLDELVDYYAVRHRVKPGMTGWAQVNGYRGELDSFEKLQNRVDFDIEYIDNWSLWLDARIIFMTMMLVFRDKAAY